jgi:hypothetical protein
MTTIPHEPSRVLQERSGWSRRLLIPEMWASVAIAAMWLSVLFAAIFGPDIVSTNGASGVGQSTTIPSAVGVALFAFLATWVVARNAFGHERKG